MIVIGIDPGKTGALCAMEAGRIVDLIDMPEDVRAVARWLRPARAFLEKVGGLPGQSAPAAFNFGHHCGQLEMILNWQVGEPTLVRPQRWKGDLRVPRDKKLSRARASELLPAEAHRWPLVKHDGRAEAAMIALWGELYG